MFLYKAYVDGLKHLPCLKTNFKLTEMETFVSDGEKQMTIVDLSDVHDMVIQIKIIKQTPKRKHLQTDRAI